ncbi:thiamine diphosphokinase [Microaerobacter geothermalis]|uniref:thiamine diphosphokinase n=1 Tax=Microaerobacter geothermalis TaxID=674972 RepID=UPI001F3FB92E|nr:thiamine diphosphokinase [Microaerobacter geothermalis]MCF6094239.1 thiamine diphosphokinase [Microaerobacter geothermalis]
MRNRRILIFTGGNLGEWALKEIKPDDVLFGVDRGAYFLVQHKIQPDLAMGDFDSVTEQEREEIAQKSKEMWACDPVIKDETDTELAVQWAIKREPSEIMIIGGLGTRFDHTLANVHLLLTALQKGIPCLIVDEYNVIMLVDRYVEIEQDHFSHISLLPLSWEVTGITLEGFQYPLNQASLSIGHSLGISNVLKEKVGRIYVESGYLLVIKSKD